MHLRALVRFEWPTLISDHTPRTPWRYVVRSSRASHRRRARIIGIRAGQPGTAPDARKGIDWAAKWLDRNSADPSVSRDIFAAPAQPGTIKSRSTFKARHPRNDPPNPADCHPAKADFWQSESVRSAGYCLAPAYPGDRDAFATRSHARAISQAKDRRSTLTSFLAVQSWAASRGRPPMAFWPKSRLSYSARQFSRALTRSTRSGCCVVENALESHRAYRHANLL